MTTVADQSVVMLVKEGAQTSDKNSSTPSVQTSDMVDDDALQQVILNLKTLSKELLKNEVFMCLSQFPFGSYLGEPNYAPAVAHLPSPTNLPSELPWNWRQGDFDVLLIHRQYGFVAFEVKAVTGNSETSVEKRIEQTTKKLKEAVKQLNKAEAMLTHLTSDIVPNVRITKTIACPNLTSQELNDFISNDEQLEQDLFECFKVKNAADVVRLILCSDHLCLPETVPPERDRKILALKVWWKDQVCVPGKNSQFSFDLYRSIIARFCGPASTVTVPCTSEPRVCIKTISQAVAHVGDCYTAYMTLFPEHIALLTREPPRVFIAGPPGSGKTTVLLLVAIKWLQHGSNVYVLSTWDRSLAASFRLCYLLRMALKTQQIDEDTAGRVIFLNKNLRNKNDVEAVLKELTRVATHGPLYVIADEVGPDFQSQYYIFPDFCCNLLRQIQNRNDDLHFWAASGQDNVAPDDLLDWDTEGWELNYFTRPLRSPPSVTREVKLAVEIRNGTVPEYSERNVPDHSDGPPVKWVYHQPQEHGCLRVEDCVVCGNIVAIFLCTELRLSVYASASVNTDVPTANNRPILDSAPVNTDVPTANNRPILDSAPVNTDVPTATNRPSLKYKDVMILSWVKLREDTPLLKALSDAEVPVRVMRDEDIEDVATARSDVVWAAQQQLVCGLMRKVVVVLNNYDDSKGKYVFTRLRAMSRCSSQLVVVCPPSDYEPE
ncbi:uncharacterized protein LOC112569429 [Pomacea canaliculata]|uniref:uncharacterized protein LOC112569429 n=1 Tax=Pomacea canaliculata TaxID=400727 RepID=UPI000D72A7AC|nr:uncharacterized protein LOC112569429 [Pomacea canaliculata]